MSNGRVGLACKFAIATNQSASQQVSRESKKLSRSFFVSRRKALPSIQRDLIHLLPRLLPVYARVCMCLPLHTCARFSIRTRGVATENVVCHDPEKEVEERTTETDI